ncbi:hypothetical protein Pfo_012511 [Paulownia fortunei]|nr:hypothetical protein Pfo_012511 [Paulownia fortunei]
MGVLEFFEATHLRVHGEYVLDHGFVFTRNYLESVLPSLRNSVAEQVHHALKQYSNRRGLTRLEARHYISIYEQWNISCLDQLPDYMKLFYKALLEVYEEIVEEMIKQGRLYRLKYGIEAVFT